MAFDDQTEETHPSYGMVQLVRRSHGGSNNVLFGSPLKGHHTTIALKLQTAKRSVRKETGHEHFWAEKHIIEVEMSAAQFAELLTTMNVGEGVPCTIIYRDGKSIEDPPSSSTEPEEVRNAFQERADELMDRLENGAKRAEELLQGSGTLKKDERKELLEVIFKLRQEVKHNMPWMVSQFQESIHKTVTAAKAEVDAFVTHTVQTTGLETLRSKNLLGGKKG